MATKRIKVDRMKTLKDPNLKAEGHRVGDMQFGPHDWTLVDFDELAKTEAGRFLLRCIERDPVLIIEDAGNSIASTSINTTAQALGPDPAPPSDIMAEASNAIPAEEPPAGPTEPVKLQPKKDGKGWICPECGRKYKSRSGIVRHIAGNHK